MCLAAKFQCRWPAKVLAISRSWCHQLTKFEKNEFKINYYNETNTEKKRENELNDNHFSKDAIHPTMSKSHIHSQPWNHMKNNVKMMTNVNKIIIKKLTFIMPLDEKFKPHMFILQSP